jgi:enoyl-CoA hydratase
MTISEDATPPEVVIALEGHVGRLRLNRPKALHALSFGMCEQMLDALAGWVDDAGVRLVMIDHTEGRGFCAGGDIRAAWESGQSDGVVARSFFFTEYRLNHLLFTYAKPVLAIMDGIVMGGGVGISQPARYRIATERTMFAMPETGIGLFPDVGGGWYLSRLPGQIGVFLGLTGARLDGAECAALGLATHYIPSDRIEALKAALLDHPDDVAALLDAAAETPPAAAILAQREAIDRLFAGDSYAAILAALDADGGEWAAKQRAILATKSPQACKVTLRLLRQGAGQTDFAGEMQVEYGLVAHVCQRNDFLEGVRALLIDKDNAPKWDPATPEGVTDHMLDRIFAPLESGEEWTPLPR